MWCSLSLSRFDGWFRAGRRVGPRWWAAWLTVVSLVAGVLVVAPGSVGAAVDPGVGAEGAPELWCSSSQRVS